MEATNASASLAFDARPIPALAIFMARKDIRYYLCGLHVSPHPDCGVYLAATDGHRLALWHDPHGHTDKPRTLRISNELINAARRRTARELRMPCDRRVSIQDGRLMIAQWNTSEGVLHKGHTEPLPLVEAFIQPGDFEVDGKYPDIWRVIPDMKDVVPGLHGAVQANYIKDLGAAAALLGVGRFCGLRHFSRGTDGNGCVLTRLTAAPNFLVVTMPMKGDEASEPIPPSFVRPKIIA